MINCLNDASNATYCSSFYILFVSIILLSRLDKGQQTASDAQPLHDWLSTLSLWIRITYLIRSSLQMIVGGIELIQRQPLSWRQNAINQKLSLCKFASGPLFSSRQILLRLITSLVMNKGPHLIRKWKQIRKFGHISSEYFYSATIFPQL